MQGVFTRLALCAAVVVAFGVVAGQALAAGNVTISQVYGGGGNAGATYQNDFIELFNRGASTVSLSGWSVQYASASGTGNFAATALAGSIAPGQHFLVKEAGGTIGATLPSADTTGSTNLSATAGKVILQRRLDALLRRRQRQDPRPRRLRYRELLRGRRPRERPLEHHVGAP